MTDTVTIDLEAIKTAVQDGEPIIIYGVEFRPVETARPRHNSRLLGAIEVEVVEKSTLEQTLLREKARLHRRIARYYGKKLKNRRIFADLHNSPVSGDEYTLGKIDRLIERLRVMEYGK